MTWLGRKLPRASTLSCSVLCPLMLCASGCSTSSEDVDVRFSLRYQGQDVGCGDVLDGLGLTGTEAELRDARIYVHDIRVVLEGGDEVPVSLDESEDQHQGVVLLDFADDSGLCQTGSPRMNDRILGQYDGNGEVEAVRFKIGLPAELNHLDAARAAAPLNAPGMAWSWTGGYKYARIDLKTSMNENWYIHLGATDCEGVPGQEISCAYSNLSEMEVPAAATGSTIAIKLESLYAGSDLDAQIDFQTDFVNGCMAFGGDPECPPIFSALGLSFESDEVGAQTVFGVAE